jgi:hypothetical protein
METQPFDIAHYMNTLVAKSNSEHRSEYWYYYGGRVTGMSARFGMSRLEMLTAALAAKK